MSGARDEDLREAGRMGRGGTCPIFRFRVGGIRAILGLQEIYMANELAALSNEIAAAVELRGTQRGGGACASPVSIERSILATECDCDGGTHHPAGELEVLRMWAERLPSLWSSTAPERAYGGGGPASGRQPASRSGTGQTRTRCTTGLRVWCGPGPAEGGRARVSRQAGGELEAALGVGDCGACGPARSLSDQHSERYLFAVPFPKAVDEFPDVVTVDTLLTEGRESKSCPLIPHHRSERLQVLKRAPPS